MKDFDADELARIELVREEFIRTARRFAFKLMEPSPIESLSTLEAKSGSAIRDEIYFFKDKGERDIALRFDFTVGLTRYVSSQKAMRLPAKLGSFGGVFRYDEPQKGRYRFFHQWNIEIFGKPSLESEAEVIEFACRLFETLNLKNIEIRINHRKIVESFIRNNYPYFDPRRQEGIFGDSFRMVDKAAKKSREDLLKEYKHLPKEFAGSLLDFAAMRGTPAEIEAKTDTASLDSWDYTRQLWDALQNRSVYNACIDFGIVRGLDYYSGAVFEVFDTQSRLGALAGGGRYDALTKAFGREDIGATGIAGGVERMILTMDEQGASRPGRAQITSILYTGEEMQKHAMRIASELRAKGILIDVDLTGRQFKRQMEAASGSRFAIIVGPRELEQGRIVLRNMVDGKESEVKIAELTEDPEKFLK